MARSGAEMSFTELRAGFQAASQLPDDVLFPQARVSTRTPSPDQTELLRNGFRPIGITSKVLKTDQHGQYALELAVEVNLITG